MSVQDAKSEANKSAEYATNLASAVSYVLNLFYHSDLSSIIDEQLHTHMVERAIYRCNELSILGAMIEYVVSSKYNSNSLVRVLYLNINKRYLELLETNTNPDQVDTNTAMCHGIVDTIIAFLVTNYCEKT